MTATPHIALMSELPLPEGAGEGDVPEWVHLLPMGRIETHDSRGPYLLEDAQAVIEASMGPRGDIEIDENHATFRAAPKGGGAPARGWITEMQAREDGIWGKVNWTPEGRRLVASRAYRRLSPVVRRLAGSRQIAAILNVSLVNRNNLRGLVALNQEQETEMDFMEKLAKALGLDAGASEGAILDAVGALKGGGGAEAQSQLDEIGKALGCEVGASADVVLNAAREAVEAGDGGESEAVVGELQSELADVTGRLNALTEANARDKAEAFVDGAIRDGHVGVKPQRERYISMHMEKPADTEALINDLPRLGATPTTLLPPRAREGEVSLNDEEAEVARMLGQDPKDFAATLEDERARKEAV